MGPDTTLNILFLTENFPPEENAAASRVYERACYWVEWGHSVTVLTTAPNFPAGKLYPGYENRWYHASDLDGIRIVRVKSFIAENRGTVLRLLDFMTFMGNRWGWCRKPLDSGSGDLVG